MPTLMLSCALEGDVSRGFDEIQKRVDSEHARSEALSTQCDQLRVERASLAKKAKA